MKKFLAMLAAAAACALPLSAQETCCPPLLTCGTFYVSGFGGANFIPDEKEHSRESCDRFTTKADFKPGFYLGTALGYKLNNTRLEVEFSYRRNSFKTHTTRDSGSRSSNHVTFLENQALGQVSCSGSDPFRFHSNIDVYAVLLNGYYDFDFCNCWNLKPYVGAGIGWGHNRFNIRFKDLGSRSHRGRSHSDEFAWQLIAGVGYPLTDCTDLALEYRFFRSGIHKVYNHGVGAALRYSF